MIRIRVTANPWVVAHVDCDVYDAQNDLWQDITEKVIGRWCQPILIDDEDWEDLTDGDDDEEG